MTKKILIADDHYVVRAGTTIILESLYKKTEIDYAINFTEVIVKTQKKQYDLLLLDINMPGSIYKKMISEIKKDQPDLKILIYTSFEEDLAIQYIKEGASGYLNKQADEKEIKNAVISVMENGFYYSPIVLNNIIKTSAHEDPIEKLSNREYEIFNLLTDGYGNLEICSKLNLTKSTISTYKNRLFKKLNVKTVFELIDFKKSIH